jgi:GNAT superfamily N-acetyltransferase
MAEYTIQPISAEIARHLRRKILRPNLPYETCIYPGDNAENTFHAGAFLNSVLVGVCTVLQEAQTGVSDCGAWRLRGVAVDPQQRGKGIGRALIESCIIHAEAYGSTYVWANGRSTALPVYTALGFSVVGDEYVTDTGPHYVVQRVLLKHSISE